MGRVRARFNARFDEDEDAWYDALRKAGVEDGDPRAIKIAYEMRIGKPGEARDGSMGGVMEKLVALAEKGMRQERPITLVEVKPE